MNSQSNFEMLKNAKKKKKRPKAINISRKAEIFYLKSLLEVSAECKKEGKLVLEVLENSGRFIGDAYVGDAIPFFDRVASIAKTGVLSRIAVIAKNIASKVISDQKKAVDDRLAKQVEFMTGINTREIIRAANAEKTINDAVEINVKYIKSIPTEYHGKLEKIIMQGMQQGKGTVWLRDEIKKLGDNTDNRVRIIVKDQIGGVSQQFNKESQQALGIGEYIWISKEDRRVRGNPNCIYPQYRHVINSHYDRHDQVMSWDEKPDDGFPGEPIMCRCDAYPYLG